MAILHVDEQNFAQEVLQSKETVLVDFWATWCGPCRMLAPILEDVAQSADFKIAKVNVDENMALSAQYGIASIPSLLVFKDGKLVNRSVGVIGKEDILNLVNG